MILTTVTEQAPCGGCCVKRKTRVIGFFRWIICCKGNPSRLQRMSHNETGSNLPFRGAHHRGQSNLREQRHLERVAEYVSYQVSLRYLGSASTAAKGVRGRRWRVYTLSSSEAAGLVHSPKKLLQHTFRSARQTASHPLRINRGASVKPAHKTRT